MTDEKELRELCRRIRDAGGVVRTKHDSADCIIEVSIRKTPNGESRLPGEPGTGWMAPIAAAERMREIIADLGETRKAPIDTLPQKLKSICYEYGWGAVLLKLADIAEEENRTSLADTLRSC